METPLLGHDMHMGRHHAPRRQRVAFTVAVQQGVLYDAGAIRTRQQPAAVGSIELTIGPIRRAWWGP